MLLLAADGRPLEPGQIVYGVHDGMPWHVEHVSYPEAEDFGASCFFGCAWVLKNCPGLTEASAGRDLRSTGLF
jgi:hypothetical protein